jgi:hypothetical protein
MSQTLAKSSPLPDHKKRPLTRMIRAAEGARPLPVSDSAPTLRIFRDNLLAGLPPLDQEEELTRKRGLRKLFGRGRKDLSTPETENTTFLPGELVRSR